LAQDNITFQEIQAKGAKVAKEVQPDTTQTFEEWLATLLTPAERAALFPFNRYGKVNTANLTPTMRREYYKYLNEYKSQKQHHPTTSQKSEQKSEKGVSEEQSQPRVAEQTRRSYDVSNKENLEPSGKTQKQQTGKVRQQPHPNIAQQTQRLNEGGNLQRKAPPASASPPVVQPGPPVQGSLGAAPTQKTVESTAAPQPAPAQRYQPEGVKVDRAPKSWRDNVTPSPSQVTAAQRRQQAGLPPRPTDQQSLDHGQAIEGKTPKPEPTYTQKPGVIYGSSKGEEDLHGATTIEGAEADRKQKQKTASQTTASLDDDVAVDKRISNAISQAMKVEGMDERNPQGKAAIEDYLKTGGINIDPETTAWCAAYVNTTLKRANIQGTGSLTANSFQNFGQGVDFDNITKGDVVLDTRGKRSDQTGGHVMMATGKTKTDKKGNQYVQVIGGNQGKEGDSGSHYASVAWRKVNGNTMFRRSNEMADFMAKGGGGNKKQTSEKDQKEDPSVGMSAELLRKYEGTGGEFSDKAYWDVNHYRLGYGSDTITDKNGNIREVQKGDVVTRDDAERDLKRRVTASQDQIRNRIGDDAWNKLDARTRASITSMTYNYGKVPPTVADAIDNDGGKDEISKAIAGRAEANNGVNRKRRLGEADYMMQEDPTAQEELPPSTVNTSRLEGTTQEEKAVATAEPNQAVADNTPLPEAPPPLEEATVRFGATQLEQRLPKMMKKYPDVKYNRNEDGSYTFKGPKLGDAIEDSKQQVRDYYKEHPFIASMAPPVDKLIDVTKKPTAIDQPTVEPLKKVIQPQAPAQASMVPSAPSPKPQAAATPTAAPEPKPEPKAEPKAVEPPKETKAPAPPPEKKKPIDELGPQLDSLGITPMAKGGSFDVGGEEGPSLITPLKRGSKAKLVGEAGKERITVQPQNKYRSDATTIKPSFAPDPTTDMPTRANPQSEQAAIGANQASLKADNSPVSNPVYDTNLRPINVITPTMPISFISAMNRAKGLDPDVTTNRYGGFYPYCKG
jgi:uncharacterized protein (TIGR02594 family)